MSDKVSSEKASNEKASSEKAAVVKDLIIEEVKAGTGNEAKSGDFVSVHYTGALTNGEVFDSSVDRGEPIEFQLGAGEVIKGWDQGIAGLKPGGKRKLTIAPALGYGARDMGAIPPNSTLIFDVELVKIASF